MGVSKTIDNNQIKIKMQNPRQEPPVSFKAPNEDLKDMDVLCTFKIKIERQNLEQGCIKDQWSYPNQDQDAKPQAGISSILQSPKIALKGHGYSLHLQNQDRTKIWIMAVSKDHIISNQGQDAKPQSVMSAVLKNSKSDKAVFFI